MRVSEVAGAHLLEPADIGYEVVSRHLAADGSCLVELRRSGARLTLMRYVRTSGAPQFSGEWWSEETPGFGVADAAEADRYIRAMTTPAR